MQRVVIHHFGAGTVLDARGLPQQGQIIYAASTASYAGKLVDALANHHRVADDQLTVDSRTWNITTNTNTLYALTYTWPTVLAAEQFFNLGGKLTAPLFGNAVYDWNLFEAEEAVPGLQLEAISVAPTPDNKGTQRVAIASQGNLVEVELEIIPNPGQTCTGGGAALCFTSNDLTGGIAAVTPTIQVDTNVGQLSYQPFADAVLTGNDRLTVSITLTNGTLFASNISNITFQPDSRVNVLASSITKPAQVPFGLPSIPGTATFTFTLQNNSTFGDGAVLNNTFTVFSDNGYNPLLVIPFNVKLNFGVVFDVSTLYLNSTITRSQVYSYHVRGYGGVLKTLTSVATSGGDPGFSTRIVNHYNTSDGRGDAILNINTLRIANGNTSPLLSATAESQAGSVGTNSVNIPYTINVVDQHLGSWISPQSANNSVMGFSYDIIDGVRSITMGFGMGGGNSWQLALSKSFGRTTGQFSNYALPQLDRKYSKVLSPDGTELIGSNVTVNGTGKLGINLCSSGNQTDNPLTPTLVRTHGAWYKDLTKINFDETYTFLCRDNEAFSWESASSGLSSFTVYLDGILESGNSGGLPFAKGIHTVRIVATSDQSVPPAVAIRVYRNRDGYDVWSTLDAMFPNWAEISRIDVSHGGGSLVPNAYIANMARGEEVNGTYTPTTYATYFAPRIANGSSIWNTLQMGLPRVTNNRYGSFLNTYGVWDNASGSGSDFIHDVNIIFPTTGSYTFEFSSDNSGQVYLDGVQIFNCPSEVTYFDSVTTTLQVEAGVRTLQLRVQNWGGPGSCGLNIRGGYDANGGAIVTVDNDGRGNLTMSLNSVSHTSGDFTTDQTLANVENIFYYYSLLENSVQYYIKSINKYFYNYRYTNIGGDATNTPYFLGFDSAGNVRTSTVATPQPFVPKSIDGSDSGDPWWYNLIISQIEQLIIDALLGEFLDEFIATGDLILDVLDYLDYTFEGGPGMIFRELLSDYMDFKRAIGDVLISIKEAYYELIGTITEQVGIVQNIAADILATGDLIATQTATLNELTVQYFNLQAAGEYEAAAQTFQQMESLKNAITANEAALTQQLEILNGSPEGLSQAFTDQVLGSSPTTEALTSVNSPTFISETSEIVNAGETLYIQVDEYAGVWEGIQSNIADIADLTSQIEGISDFGLKAALEYEKGLLAADSEAKLALLKTNPVFTEVSSPAIQEGLQSALDTLTVDVTAVADEVALADTLLAEDMVASLGGPAAEALLTEAGIATDAALFGEVTVIIEAEEVIETVVVLSEVSEGAGLLLFLAEVSTCFTGATPITMHDGSKKRIDQIKIGDMVMNYDNTRVNRVAMVQEINSTVSDALWSPNEHVQPFASMNHPIYINGELSSAEPDIAMTWHPWVGPVKKLDCAVVAKNPGLKLYNIYPDGDASYRVYDWGAPSLASGDDLGVRMLEQGVITFEQLHDALNSIMEQAANKYGPNLVYGGYILNDLLIKLNINWVMRFGVKFWLIKNPILLAITNRFISAVGAVARTINKLKQR
jgi:hypothetical protein